MRSLFYITVHLLLIAAGIYGQGTSVEDLKKNSTLSKQVIKQQTARRDQQHFRTAQSYINHHRYSAAISILEDLVIRNSQNTSYYDWLLRSYLMISELPRADSLVSEMLRRKPDNPHFQIGKANILYRQGQEKEALRLWKMILVQNPDNLNLYSQIANAMIENRLWDEAVLTYQKAIESLPNATNFYMNIANIYKNRLMYLEATEYYLKYLAVQPKQQRFVFNQILAFQIPEEQQEEFLMVLEKRTGDPDQPREIKILLAQLYHRYRKFDKALHIYIQLEQDKNDELRILKFAQAAERDSVFLIALQAYKFLIRKNPSSKQIFLAYRGAVSCQFQLARQFNEAYHAEQANLLIDTLSNRFPNHPELFQLYYLQGMFQLTYYFDVDRALSIFSKITRSKKVPTNLRSQVLLKSGECYIIKGQLDQAMKIFQQVNHSSSKGYANFRRAQTSYFMKNWEESDSLIQELIQAEGMGGKVTNDALSLQLKLNHAKQNEAILIQSADADLLIFQQKKSEAIKILMAMVTMDQVPTAIKSQSYLDICHLALDLDDPLVALEYSKLAMEDPEIAAYADLHLFLMGTILEEQFQKYQEAFYAYRELLEKYPNSMKAEDSRLKMRNIRQKEGWELP
ncbi:MAG: tetratricopeptide repeat protein [Calditrichia bacterium]|nr:tetratricopeptide repeat protein [Calditrichia bacterium]